MGEDPGDLHRRRSGDGSFSLWSERFGEAFHSAEGALGEARAKFVEPAELDRVPAGGELVVLECCVGTATNTAALIEAVRAHGLQLRWWGLELDPRPWPWPWPTGASAPSGSRPPWRCWRRCARVPSGPRACGERSSGATRAAPWRS